MQGACLAHARVCATAAPLLIPASWSEACRSACVIVRGFSSSCCVCVRCRFVLIFFVAACCCDASPHSWSRVPQPWNCSYVDLAGRPVEPLVKYFPEGIAKVRFVDGALVSSDGVSFAVPIDYGGCLMSPLRMCRRRPCWTARGTSPKMDTASPFLAKPTSPRGRPMFTLTPAAPRSTSNLTLTYAH